jgi:hypothetical protein
MAQRRTPFAEKIASGIGGWLQLQVAQGVEELIAESAVQLKIAQIVNATGRYVAEFSRKPKNWGKTKKRVDVALKGSQRSGSWYGSAETKWIGTSFDTKQARLSIVQDVMRTTFIDTQGLNANLIILGGTKKSIKRLFDQDHRSESYKRRKEAFCELLSRNTEESKGELTSKQWFEHFEKAGERIPSSVFGNFDGKLKTDLLAVSAASLGEISHGQVFVWQCNRTRGTQG